MERALLSFSFLFLRLPKAKIASKRQTCIAEILLTVPLSVHLHLPFDFKHHIFFALRDQSVLSCYSTFIFEKFGDLVTFI